MGHIVAKKKPKSDFAPPKVPEHDMPYTWLGDPRCLRCGMTLSAIEQTGRPCYTDEQIRDARIMGRIVKRLRHG